MTTYTPSEVASRLGIGEDRVRKIVRQEVAAMVPDELRMIPGGRVNEKVMVVFAGVFDAVTGGHAVTRTSPTAPQMLHSLPGRKVAS